MTIDNTGYQAELIIPAPQERVTVVIPVRLSQDRLDISSRLRRNPLADQFRPEGVSFLIVDDGSDRQSSEDIKMICQEHGYGLLRIESHNSIFSIGRCRNYGAMYTATRYIFFQDVDLIPTNGFYKSLLDEIEVQNLDNRPFDFIMVPCIYLTEQGNTAFWETDENLRRQTFYHHALLNDEELVEKVSCGTSANLYNRHYYLARGGNDPDFKGWGHEDLEFNCRMIRLGKKFPLPREWTLEKGNFTNVIEYKGWKAPYRLYGDMCWNKGIVLFHEWHPVNHSGEYQKQRAVTRSIFLDKLARFKNERQEPEPLPDMRAGRTLIFRDNAFTLNREVQPLYGEIFMESEDDFTSQEKLAGFVEDNDISRVVFHNPHSNEQMQNIYGWLREMDVPYIVCERGALEGSLFYDPNGFLSDSSSYDRAHWNHALSEQQKEQIIAYCHSARLSEQALEAQSKRMPKSDLRKDLKIKRFKKVLFVALQRPGDSATLYYTRDKTYPEYIEMLQELDLNLPKDWVMVVKKHPLEDDNPVFENAVDAGDAHFKDLIDLADCVLTFNSGVGLIAMMWEKPVLLAGDAFYQFDEINSFVNSADQIVSHLTAPKAPNTEMILQFLYYLVFRFYSFASFDTKQTLMPDGTRMTATMGVDFFVLRFPGYEERAYPPKDKKYEIGWNSLLFDRYRHLPNLYQQFFNLKFWSRSRFLRKVRKFYLNPVAFVKDMRAKNLH